MIPIHLKEDDKIYFIPYTTDKPQITLGRITEGIAGEKFIAYGYYLADNGEWYICEEKDIGKPETITKINNLLQKISEVEDGI